MRQMHSRYGLLLLLACAACDASSAGDSNGDSSYEDTTSRSFLADIKLDANHVTTTVPLNFPAQSIRVHVSVPDVENPQTSMWGTLMATFQDLFPMGNTNGFVFAY